MLSYALVFIHTHFTELQPKMSNLEKSFTLLGLGSDGASLVDTNKAYRWPNYKLIMGEKCKIIFRKKVLSYANSATGSGKLAEISAAFVEV